VAVTQGSHKAARGLYGNAYLLLALASLCWSGNHLMGRAIAGHVPPLTISTLRWLLAAAVLFPFIRGQLARDWPVIRSHLGVLVYLALIGGGVFGALQFVGLQLTTALNVSVMNSLGPVFIAAASAAMFGDRLSPGQFAGIFVSLLGVLAIITKLDPAVLTHFSFNIGDIIIFINMILWAVYSASLRWRPKIHPVSFMFMFCLISGTAMLPAMAWEYSTGFVLQPNLTLTSSAGSCCSRPCSSLQVAGHSWIEVRSALYCQPAAQSPAARANSRTSLPADWTTTLASLKSRCRPPGGVGTA